MKIKKLLVLAVALSLSSCSSFKNSGFDLRASNGGKEEGLFWCNERYLDIDGYPEPGSAADSSGSKKFSLARKGYMYALAAALTLQDSSDFGKHYFAAPDYLERVIRLEEDDRSTGFQASTFILYSQDDPVRVEKIIVAFRGTDEWRDWWTHSLAFLSSPSQFAPAREYVKRVAEDPQLAGHTLVATGFSLGGGLAAHVALHPDTAAQVSQAWAFNPSPRTGFSEGGSNIYVTAVQGELLNIFRRGRFAAPQANYADDYDLVNSSSWYGHSRWVLTRQMLLFADLAEYEISGRTLKSTPALEILRKSQFEACTPETLSTIAARRKNKESPLSAVQ